ncbi:MAG: pilus assembly protein [Chloroflexi bacterium]|nr:pilus assembly protein [Chloroflexota bacterium]
MQLIKRRSNASPRGQALVEFALILPLFVMVLVGVIVLGIIVFYNQQLTNAARETARYAAIHSATDPFCPVVGHLDPAAPPIGYARCDPVDTSWPNMTAYGRTNVFGINPSGVIFSACWSGYQSGGTPDARPPGTYVDVGVYISAWTPCSIGGVDPTLDPGSIGCAPGLTTVDTASNLSEGPGRIVANRVTAFACYQWSPPMAGFLLIPQTVTFRAVISEPIQRQQ